MEGGRDGRREGWKEGLGGKMYFPWEATRIMRIQTVTGWMLASEPGSWTHHREGQSNKSDHFVFDPALEDRGE